MKNGNMNILKALTILLIIAVSFISLQMGYEAYWQDGKYETAPHHQSVLVVMVAIAIVTSALWAICFIIRWKQASVVSRRLKNGNE